MNREAENERKLWFGIAREIAHDMGTPLSSVLGWLELLPNLDNPDAAIEEIEKSLTRINQLSRRLELLGLAPNLQPVPLKTVIDEVVTIIEKRLPSSGTGVNIISNVDGEILVNCQKDLLAWGFECIIKNSLEATITDGGTITVSARKEQGQFLVEVSDTGEGIAEEHIESVFDAGFTTKRSGRGVGLSLARYIINEVHGGKVEVKSSTPGEGTTVSIRLNSITV